MMENFEIKKNVTEDMLAVAVGSGSLRVLATPVVVAMMEEASAKLAETMLDNGYTTVGVNVNISHISPTPLGAEVRAVSKLIKSNGKAFVFEVTAFDNIGEIANGTHQRVAVFAEKFQTKADSKLG